MRAVVLTRPAPIEDAGLELRDVPVPEPGPGEVLLEVLANAICRTDLHVIEGELSDPKLPLIVGHQIVGVVEQLGEGTDGVCPYCVTGNENLCDRPTFTGYQRDGGYAEYATARADFVLPIPASYDDVHAAPLLCAGLIGFRSLRLAEVEGLERPGRLGLYGFGSSAHIIIQAALHLGHEVYVYTRGETGKRLARDLGAVWVGGGDEVPPVELDSVIIFAPAGPLVPIALRAVRKGGVVVCAGIHMSPIPEFSYDLLWSERVVRSVANLTRADGDAFFRIAADVPLEIAAEPLPLAQANEALERVRSGQVHGAAVLVI